MELLLKIEIDGAVTYINEHKHGTSTALHGAIRYERAADDESSEHEYCLRDMYRATESRNSRDDIRDCHCADLQVLEDVLSLC